MPYRPPTLDSFRNGRELFPGIGLADLEQDGPCAGAARTVQRKRMPETATIRQHPERALPDLAPDILTRGLVAHVGFVDEGRPCVIPMSYHYDPGVPDRLYLHGSLSSRALDRAASGDPVSACVTTLEGLVYSRTALYHSMNYHSVVCFGRGRMVADTAQKDRLLRAMIGRYFAGRTAGVDYEAPPVDHLTGTALVEVTIEQWSAKARTGGPKGPRDADSEALGTCGVAPLPYNEETPTGR